MRFNLIERNQFITISEFWFKLKRSTKYLFAFSKIILLILGSSDLHGFSNRQGVLVLKFVLWSFSVINAGYLTVHSIVSSNLMLFAICFASKFIAFSKQGVAILYVLVMPFFNSFLYSVGESSKLRWSFYFCNICFDQILNLVICFWIWWISSRSFSNVSSSLICAGQFFDLKPKDSVSHSITLPPMKKCAFHRVGSRFQFYQ